MGTSANLNSTGSLTRGMSASTTSGLYLRRIISSVIVSEKLAASGKTFVRYRMSVAETEASTYALCLEGNVPLKASVSGLRTAADEIKAL